MSSEKAPEPEEKLNPQFTRIIQSRCDLCQDRVTVHGNSSSAALTVSIWEKGHFESKHQQHQSSKEEK